MISILMPYFGNRIEQLKRTLYMLDNQAYSDKFELIIIQDDGENKLTSLFNALNLDVMQIKSIITRTENSTWRTPNYALKAGYEQCEGNFVVVTSPEILVPVYALQAMEDWNTHITMLVPILYKLSRANQKYIDTVRWYYNLDFLKDLPGFWSEEINPGGYYNYEAEDKRHHGGFVGADRDVWDEIGFMPDPEQEESDSYWHRRLLELGKVPVHMPLEVYHQWHPRKDDPDRSIRIKRINADGLGR